MSDSVTFTTFDHSDDSEEGCQFHLQTFEEEDCNSSICDNEIQYNNGNVNDFEDDNISQESNEKSVDSLTQLFMNCARIGDWSTFTSKKDKYHSRCDQKLLDILSFDDRDYQYHRNPSSSLELRIYSKQIDEAAHFVPIRKNKYLTIDDTILFIYRKRNIALFNERKIKINKKLYLNHEFESIYFYQFFCNSKISNMKTIHIQAYMLTKYGSNHHKHSILYNKSNDIYTHRKKRKTFVNNKYKNNKKRNKKYIKIIIKNNK